MILGAAWAMATALLLIAGCGKSGPSTMEDLRGDIAAKLPAGWQVSFVKDINFPVIAAAKPTDLVVWKTDRAELEVRAPATQPAPPTNVYFAITATKYIEPEKFREIWRKNQDIIDDHERVLHMVNTVPRSPTGELLPRGDAEVERVKEFRAKFAELPPYDKDLPTHYYDTLGLVLHDMRPTLVPVERDYQKQQNEVYVSLVQILKEYKK